MNDILELPPTLNTSTTTLQNQIEDSYAFTSCIMNTFKNLSK